MLNIRGEYSSSDEETNGSDQQKSKDDMDISSDSSSSDEDTAIGAYWDSNVGLPFTDLASDEEF